MAERINCNEAKKNTNGILSCTLSLPAQRYGYRAFFVSLALALIGAVALLLTACGGAPKAASSASGGAADSAQAASTGVQAAGSDAPLTLVLENREMPRGGEAGFYAVEAPRFDDTCNIMFYDYATLQQRYLCADPACTHDHAGCTSFLNCPLGSASCFTVGGELYLVYHKLPEAGEENNPQQSMLERRELDGTNAQMVAQSAAYNAFDGRGTAFTDGAALYTPEDGGGTLTRTDLATGEMKILPWNQDCIPIPVTHGRALLSIRREGTGNVPSASTALYATNVDTGDTKALHSWPEGVYSYFGAPSKDGKLYYVNLTSRVIMAYDLATGVETPLTDAFAKYGEPYARDYAAEGWEAEFAEQAQEQSPIEYPATMWGGQLLGDWMIVTLDSPAPSHRYAYNMQTAELKELTLTDYYNGGEYFLAPHALTPHGLAVTQEHRTVTVHSSENGVPSTYEGSYEIYALMDMEDYLASNPNFRTLEPVEYKSA